MEPVVDAGWLADNLDSVVVLDSRWYLDGRSGRDAFEQGHLPSAAFADLDLDLSAPAGPGGRHPLPEPAAFAAAMGRLGVGDGSSVVVYDDAGGVIAARAWWMLQVLGHDVAILDGGFGAWTGPLETGPATHTPATFTPRSWPAGQFISADQVAAADSAIQLIDARSKDRYEGVSNGIDPRFGHIPGALSFPAGENVATDGSFLDTTMLAARYQDLDKTQPVVAYCGSGVTACADLLALTRLGYTNLSLYTGSWSEWGADTARPLETG